MKKFWLPLVIGVASLLGPLIWWLLWAWPYGISHSDWDVLGTSIKNVSGLYAVEAALMAAYIAWRTNQSRAEEAIKADYRDRIKWAVENFYSNNFYISEYAISTIEALKDDADRLPISGADKGFLKYSKNQIPMRRKYLKDLQNNVSERVEELDKYLQKLLKSPFGKEYWSDDLKKLFMETLTTKPAVDGDISEAKVFRYMDTRERFILLCEKEKAEFLKNQSRNQ